MLSDNDYVSGVEGGKADLRGLTCCRCPFLFLPLAPPPLGPPRYRALACVSRSLAGRRRDRGRVSSLCRRKFRVTEHTRDRVFYQHSSAYQQRQPHQARRRRVFTLRLETLSGSTAPNSALTVTVDDRHERYTASNTPVPPHVPVDTRR